MMEMEILRTSPSPMAGVEVVQKENKELSGTWMKDLCEGRASAPLVSNTHQPGVMLPPT